MDIFSSNSFCFACGKNNSRGLKLQFEQKGDKTCTTYVPSATFQGYPGLLHGGITCTILDDIMSRCVNTLGVAGMTARLEVRFRRSIPIGKPLYAEAWITKKKGPLVETEARAYLENGEVAAEATARFMTFSPESMHENKISGGKNNEQSGSTGSVEKTH